jgi:hypothetical protein
MPRRNNFLTPPSWPLADSLRVSKLQGTGGKLALGQGLLARLSVLLCVAVIFAFVLLPFSPVRATDGRDFAGFYEVTNVTDLGDTVRLTLTVRVYNYSDADVSGATVTLQDPSLVGNDYGSYPGTVSIADRESARLSAEFTISRAEYDRWQEGATPSLRIDYTDSAGNAIRRMIELAQMPVGEE